MQIHRIRGNDLNDALRRAKRTHGDGAVVIGHERTSDGGITLAVTIDQATKAPGAEESAPKPARSPKPADVVRFPKAQPDAKPAQRSGVELELANRMAAAGASTEWIERCLDSIDSESDEHPIDQVGNAIGESFSIARMPRAAGLTRVLALVGPTDTDPGGDVMPAAREPGKEVLGLVAVDGLVEHPTLSMHHGVGGEHEPIGRGPGGGRLVEGQAQGVLDR